jgi:tetratricopeptide (TPR) repeat protein
MEGILNHMSQIKGLRVLSRNSTEKYRETSTPSPKIAKELNVNYLIEASVFKSGNRIRITAQLIDAPKDEHIWSKQYDREINDIFYVMGDISKEVASEIEVVISAEVKERIESIPTENQEAYDRYLRGIEFQNRYYSNGNVSNFNTSIHFFKEAIELDPEFAHAYVELGWTYVGFAGITELIKDSYLDTVKFFSMKALSIDPDLSEGYVSLGWYNYAKGNLEKSIENYEKAIDLNPNNFFGYWNLADSYKANNDYIHAIANYEKVKKLVIGTGYYPDLLRWLGNAYQDISYYDKAEAEYLELVNFDPLAGYLWLSFLTGINGEWDKMMYFKDQICTIDSGNICWQAMQNLYYYHKDFTNALKFFEKSQEAKEELNLGDFNWWWNNYLYAYILYNVNRKEEALVRFRKQVEMSEESIRLKRDLATGASGGFAYYAMAASYIHLGEKDKAYETLHEMERNAFSGWYTWKIQVDPVFESLWEDEEFRQIIGRQEMKFAEIRKKINYMEDEGFL